MEFFPCGVGHFDVVKMAVFEPIVVGVLKIKTLKVTVYLRSVF